MTTAEAAQLARLRTRFPQWQIIRTQCGTFVAHHLATHERVRGQTVAELENRLIEWGTRHRHGG
jgi:hypothetical protein